MSTQAKRATIQCELCNRVVEVNYRHQRMKTCAKCSRKLNLVAVKVQKEVDAQKAEAKAKAAKKKAKQPPRFKCPHCETIFPCPTCQKDVKKKPRKKAKKSVAGKGGRNAKK